MEGEKKMTRERKPRKWLRGSNANLRRKGDSELTFDPMAIATSPVFLSPEHQAEDLLPACILERMSCVDK